MDRAFLAVEVRKGVEQVQTNAPERGARKGFEINKKRIIFPAEPEVVT